MKTPKKELKALLNLAKECLEKPNTEVCQTYKDKILEACPSLKVESDVLEVGQWYEYCLGLFFITAFENGKKVKGYGFLYNEWEDNRNKDCFMGTKNDEDWKKADPKKVEELLIAECEKKGIWNVPIIGAEDNRVGQNKSYSVYFNEEENKLWSQYEIVFYKGKFATKYEETISLSEAERRLNLKIKID